MKRHHMAESYEQLQHKIAIEIHQKRENSKVGSIMVAQFATTRKWQMPSNVQWRKQNKYYTGHKILQIRTVIGQLDAAAPNSLN